MYETHTRSMHGVMLTNQLTKWGWVLLYKPPVAQLLQNFLTLYGTRRFFTMFTRAHHWYLSWASLIQSIPPLPSSLRSNLILSYHLHLGLPSGPFPSGFPTEILYAFLFYPYVLHALPISSSLKWTLYLCFAKSTSYVATHNAIFSNLLLFYAPSIQILFSAPCSQIPSVYVFP
jgi:hypothetical protein